MANNLVYSITMGIFVSRLITELFFEGSESWYEVPAVAVIATIIHYIRLQWKN